MAKIAVIEIGGKQHVVTNDSIIHVDGINGTRGDKLSIDKVLLTDDGSQATFGAPYIAGASVMAEIVDEGHAKKITVIRYRPKSRYFKKKGHKQQRHTLRITQI